MKATGAGKATGFKHLPRSLQVYILLHVGGLLPAAILIARLPNPDHAGVTGTLLLVAAIAGVWRIEVTLKQSRQSLVFAVVCLALLLQGAQAATLCASVGALLTHLVRPEGGWWRLRYFSQPLYRRVFNVAHCALACAVAGWLGWMIRPLAHPGWLRELSELVLFTSSYFLINTFGVAAAIAFEQGQSPVAVWREHCFWMAPVYFISAAVAGGIAVAFYAVGPVALLLLPCFYLVYAAYRTYIDTLRKQKELLAEVNRLYRREEEANRRKDEFLAALAHELRNPLAAISNAQYLLERRAVGGTSDRPVETIGRQSRLLQRLVEDLLDVSRITRGIIELRMRRADLREVLQGAVEAVNPLIAAKRHTLRLDTPDQPLFAVIDPVRIEQVFVNLLGNAAKYTPPGGDIQVSLGVENGAPVFRVRDNGLGIDPEHLSAIFELFTQEKRSLAASEGGLGIGLTLVKRLVELHHGELEAFSAGPDQGSEFTVRLPPSDGPELSEAGGGPGLKEVAPVQAVPRIVLIAEDQEDAAASLKEILELWGYTVRLARSGEQALELARREPPHVGILDVGLPGMDGYTLARKLREEGSQAVLVALTGSGQAGDRHAALQAGFDYHRVKPVDLEELRTFLDGAAPVHLSGPTLR